ncbi:DNA-binding response regulator [Curtobacterium sp. MCPF17_047]|uniref:response regulator transcription factor n=1 Tax=Curtobacterium sp. MCPF17_047 TaxID=2175654 RepID=UPI000DA79DC7|nr:MULTISPECIES: response regulator transcription factor [unclassified Curtobacterium]PZF67880.1 DNA-binding response regulator [Curtobacterium sp. MCPF17_047]WIB14020.1 response regulator transcription factor [Curtobacterium sp. MCPF17_052]
MKVFVAEDAVLLREGLVSLLERAGHTVVGVAADARRLVDEVDALVAAGATPDVVLTDVRMPPTGTDDGLRAAVVLRERHDGLPVVVLSQYVAGAYVRELLDDGRGGVGYLLKDRVGKVPAFLRALETVADGGVVVDPEVVRHLTRSQATDSPLARLTPRETTVLEHMAEGASNADIAATLHLSDAAVAKHVGNVFTKLDLPPEDTNRRVRAVLTYLREKR